MKDLLLLGNVIALVRDREGFQEVFESIANNVTSLIRYRYPYVFHLQPANLYSKTEVSMDWVPQMETSLGDRLSCVCVCFDLEFKISQINTKAGYSVEFGCVWGR